MKTSLCQSFLISSQFPLQSAGNNNGQNLLTDTKNLMDSPGLTPILFERIINNLKINKKIPNEAIESIEEIILQNTSDSNSNQSFNFTPIDFNSSREIPFESIDSNNIQASEMQTMYNSLNKAWLFLTKMPSSEYRNNSTLIHFDLPFFVPGGRFNEFYYWDSFWILKGLLGMKMEISAVTLIKNFILMIEKYGYILNGSRMYYEGRTQPPFFTQMIYLLYNYDRNKYGSFILGEALNAAITEYNWFIKNRSVTLIKEGQSYTLARYFDESELPRLESFREDYTVALDFMEMKQNFTDHNIKKLFTDLRSAAESGWDFSTRWFLDGKDLKTIHTSGFIPADLNAVLFKNEKIISELLFIKGDIHLANEFQTRSKQREEAIQMFLWNSKQEIWNDYDFVNLKLNDKRFYFSNVIPLLMDINPPSKNLKTILKRYEKELFGYIGGAPCSGETNFDSKQQWDFPNVWAPHQSLLVDFLMEKEMDELAIHTARSFYENVKKGFKTHGVFFEKYNCLSLGETGNGGEYLPQEGFGWTNGVTIDFIVKFGKKMLQNFDHESSFKFVSKLLTDESKVENPLTFEKPLLFETGVKVSGVS